MSTQKKAQLRVCASCLWVFHADNPESIMCPQCGFAHYGARFVYGNAAYRYAKTQKPWFEKKMTEHATKLHAQIAANNAIRYAEARAPHRKLDF